MRTSKPTGTPFTARSTEGIDQWSRNVFRALSGWAETLKGRWTRWDDGYLLLEIDRWGEEAIDSILIHTADEELHVEFGYWETELPKRPVTPKVRQRKPLSSCLIGCLAPSERPCSRTMLGTGAAP